MIQITKAEKELLVEMFPDIRFPRTMKQDSKRHHYFCTETIELMRPIASSNIRAAEFVREHDRRRQQHNRRKHWGQKGNGNGE